MDVLATSVVSRSPAERPRFGRGAAPVTLRVVVRTVLVALLGTALSLGVASAPAHAAENGEFVRGGFTYDAGATWTSNSGQYQLVMQTDANLVLYDQWAGVPIWASNTQSRRHAGRFAMMNSGRAEVYVGLDTTWTSFWDIRRNSDAFMKVQDDGKLMVYLGTPEAPGRAYSWNCIWNPRQRPNTNFCLV